MLLVITDNPLGPAFDNFKLVCKHSCSAVSPHDFSKSGSWERSASALAAPWRWTPMLSSAPISAPPWLFWARQKRLWRSWFSLFSAHVLSTLSLTNLDLSPWWHISLSDLSLCEVSPAQLQMCWCGTVMVSTSSAAPCTNSCVLSTTWAWREVIIATLPYLERAWESLHINAFFCVDTPILPRLFGRTAHNKKYTQF